MLPGPELPAAINFEKIDRQKCRLEFPKSYFSFRRSSAWLVTVIVLLQILLFNPGVITRNTRRQSPENHRELAAIGGHDLSDSAECPYGKVFVYELPEFFNAEIVRDCENLNPWHSRCDALSNSGLGTPAAAEMSKWLPANVTGSWFWTDQFSLELIHHRRVLNYKCRTLSPESASAFYIPIYAGLAIERLLFTGNSTAADRDLHCEKMLNFVTDQPFFKKSSGRNHFMTMGRISWDFRRSDDKDWGSGCIYKPAMRNITRLLIERNPWDYFDIGVPYPTGFHPTSAADLLAWQNFVATRPRSTLFSFAGGARSSVKDDFRAILLRQCESDPDSCRAVDCSGTKCETRTSAALESFLESEFCLQPRGDSFTRRSVFDCMIAGAIPVFFWHRTAYVQYSWFLPGEPESYSVYIDRGAVRNGTAVKSVLESINKETVTKMREKVIQTIPKLVYANSDSGLDHGVEDAFDVAMKAQKN